MLVAHLKIKTGHNKKGETKFLVFPGFYGWNVSFIHKENSLFAISNLFMTEFSFIFVCRVKSENWRGDITKIVDIEENIWCTKLGIKGKIDVSLETVIILFHSLCWICKHLFTFILKCF